MLSRIFDSCGAGHTNTSLAIKVRTGTQGFHPQRKPCAWQRQARLSRRGGQDIIDIIAIIAIIAITAMIAIIAILTIIAIIPKNPEEHGRRTRPQNTSPDRNAVHALATLEGCA